MSCKRSDINNLIGCRIGDVAISGCSRDCCPYDDDKVSEYNRHHLMKNPISQYGRSEISKPAGRTGLHYVACQTSWRPKFICPKPTCRRGIKPAYDPDKNDYQMSEYGDWEVRPKPEREPGLKAALGNQARLRSKANWKSEKKREIDALRKRYQEDEENGLTEEEKGRLKTYEPYLWWRRVITIPRYYELSEKHLVRCPSCGEGAMRVGSTLRIPKKTDEKGWKDIEEMIERGYDMVAKFSVCSTFEVHEEMVEEAQMRKAKKETEGSWLEEKKRRIEALGLTFKD